LPLLVVQRGHVPRIRGATGGPFEQQVAIAVAVQIAAMRPAGWTLRIIDADEPVSRYAGDAFVSLHCDASGNPSVRGASVGHRTPEGRALGAAWKAAYATAGWPWPFRADNYTPALAGYYGTGHAVRAGNRRAVIVEQGFTTNATERAWLLSAAGQRTSARAVWWAVTGRDPLTPIAPPVSQEDDDLTPEQAKKLDEIHASLAGRNYADDLRRIRHSIRVIGRKLGINVNTRSGGDDDIIA
jgi:hypothetical protein